MTTVNPSYELPSNLKDGAATADTPPVLIYNTGENHWERFKAWPLSCASGCEATPRPLYLGAGGTLSFTAPASDVGAADAFDAYVSDPAKPVPFSPRPVRFSDTDAWRRWLVTDQRFVDGRPDVLTYVTEPLTSPLRLGGTPRVNLVASTSGSDADWVVKLIDVFPAEVPSEPAMGAISCRSRSTSSVAATGRASSIHRRSRRTRRCPTGSSCRP